MHYSKVNLSFQKSSTFFICLHWVLFGLMLCQETIDDSAVKKSKREKLISNSDPASTTTLKEFSNVSNVTHLTSPEIDNNHPILNTREEIAVILLSSQSTAFLESRQSPTFLIENSNSSHIQTLPFQRSYQSSNKISSSLTQEQHTLMTSASLFSSSDSFRNFSENNISTISALEKSTKLFKTLALPSENRTYLVKSTPIFEPSLLEISSNFVFSFSSVKKENSVSSINIFLVNNSDIFSSTPTAELFSLEHKQDIHEPEIIILISNTPLPSSCATEITAAQDSGEFSKIPELSYSKGNSHFLHDTSCSSSQNLGKRKSKNNAFDYSSDSQSFSFEKSPSRNIDFVEVETISTKIFFSTTTNIHSLKTEITSPSPIDIAISSLELKPPHENAKISLETSFLETNIYSILNSEHLIEITPSLTPQRSSKEAIFESTTFEDRSIDNAFSNIITTQTYIDQPLTIINITEVGDNQNASVPLKEYDAESMGRNKTSRDDSPHLDDIISGILHLIAGDVKMIHPPANFHVPYSPVPMFRPTKPSSTRINNRGPPTFISPSRTVVLFSQPDRPLTLVPRPVHPPTPWNVRPTNIHRPPVLRPVVETNRVNFPGRPDSPTRPENIHTSSTSVVHLYKPLFNSHSNPEHSHNLPFNGEMFVAVAKPSKDKQQNANNNNKDISQGIRIKQGTGTFEVFRPPLNDKYINSGIPNSHSWTSPLVTKASSSIKENITSQLIASLELSKDKTLETNADWAPLLEHPIKKFRPEMEGDSDRLPDDREILIITQPTIFDLTVTNSIAGLQKTNLKPQSSRNSESSTKMTSQFSVNIPKPSNATTEVNSLMNPKIRTNVLPSPVPIDRQTNNQTNTKAFILSSMEDLKPTVLTSFSTPQNFPSFISTPALQDSIKSVTSSIQSKYQAMRKYSTKLTSKTIDSSVKLFKSQYDNYTNSLRINKTSILTPSLELKSPIYSVTRYSMTSSKVNDRFNDRTLLGRPIVVPVDIEEVRPYVGAINPPPRQGSIPTSQNFPHGRPLPNESNIQVAQAGINVNDNGRGSVSNLPTGKPPQVRLPTQRLRPNSPLVRIDSCIVGDETTCNGKLNETCKSQLGISSCQCRAGFARMFIRGPCQPVVSIMLSVKLDRFENQKISFTPRYNDPSTEEYKMMEFEAKQALSSLFTYTAFGRHFLGVSVNKFYGIGNHLIANATIHLEENRLTRAPSMRLRIRQEVLQAIKQKNHNIGDSRLYADGPLNPVPAVEDVNECADSNMNDCAVDAICQNIFGTFQCMCRAGFIDASPFDERMSGRRCSACSPDYCHNHGICYVENSEKLCRCSGNYIGARCDIDSEVLGVAVGASVAAIIIILLTLTCLCVWNRRWKREQQRTEVMSARSVNSNQTFSYLNKLAKANTYRLTVEDRMRWAHISDVVSNLYAKPDAVGGNQNIGLGQGGYPDLIRCQSPTDDSLSWYNCGTRPRPRTIPYVQNQAAASFYDMNYPSQEMFMVPSHTTSRRNLNQNIQRTYYS